MAGKQFPNSKWFEDKTKPHATHLALQSSLGFTLGFTLGSNKHGSARVASKLETKKQFELIARLGTQGLTAL